MGAVLARFRKEKSSADVLETLETEIRTIEKYSLTTQEKQKRLVGNFLVISIGLYAVGFCIVYFIFFPPTWPERITYSVPLLAFPMLIFLLRRMLAWFFQRKINKNSTKLVKLRAEKKKILEQVMEKETYNVASKLLSKYGGDRTLALKSTSLPAPTPKPNRSQVDNRNFNLNTSITALSSRPGSGSLQSLTAMNQSLLSAASNGQQTISPMMPRSPMTTQAGSTLRYRGGVTPHNNALAVQNPRPYPLINPKNQGIFEKVVDYLMGEGPQNRYALICKECFAHNGMARQEEFDYATFRCAFCNELNPSRKSRPVAPRIDFGMSPNHNRMIDSLLSRKHDSSSESSEESDGSSHEMQQPSPLKMTATTKEEEATAENNNEYLNSNGAQVPNEESESRNTSEAEDKPGIEHEEEEHHEATKESETKQ